MSLERRILVIDADAGFRRFANHVLSSLGYTVVEATSGRAGLGELQHWTPDCVIVELDLPDLRGTDVIRAIASGFEPRPPVVAVAAEISVSEAVEAMKLGAKDVVHKPIDTDHLRGMVLRAVESGDLARDVARIDALLPAGFGADALVAESTAMRAVVDRIERLAAVEMPLLIVGERGSGKGALARHLHAVSPRSNRPFVLVPDSDSPGAAEHALFGSNGRPSAFVQAQDGIVFIESVVALGPNGQERLARALAELSTARASGEPVSCPRIVIGSDRELIAEVEAGRLREDLARRLSPLSVHVPPLRERKKDIPELVRRLVAKVAREQGRPPVSVGEDAIRVLVEREWSGNLRELHALVVRCLVLARDGRIRVEDLTSTPAIQIPAAPVSAGAAGWAPTVDSNGAVLRYDEYEAEIFRFALERAGGCVSRAAEMLGVGRATMYRKMRSYEIDAPPVSERAILRTGRKPRRDEDTVVVAA